MGAAVAAVKLQSKKGKQYQGPRSPHSLLPRTTYYCCSSCSNRQNVKFYFYEHPGQPAPLPSSKASSTHKRVKQSQNNHNTTICTDTDRQTNKQPNHTNQQQQQQQQTRDSKTLVKIFLLGRRSYNAATDLCL